MWSRYLLLLMFVVINNNLWIYFQRRYNYIKVKGIFLIEFYIKILFLTFI